MKELCTEMYHDQRRHWPKSGKHILAHYDHAGVVVYQAYRPAIGEFAATHGYFGGEFSYSRMSWIKPSFLWMMYRSGWGTKPGQEVTLAIWLRRDFFDHILSYAVASTFGASHFDDETDWQTALKASDVRLQWDPDHDPAGNAVERRAIQLGLRGDILRTYGRDAIMDIEDVSDIVATQREKAVAPYKSLQIPSERVYVPEDPTVRERLKLRVRAEITSHFERLSRVA